MSTELQSADTVGQGSDKGSFFVGEGVHNAQVMFHVENYRGFDKI